MSTSTELREAYRQLAASAPTHQQLVSPGLPRRERLRRPAFQLVAAAVLVLAVVATPLVLLRHLNGGGDADELGAPNVTVPYSTSYALGTAAVPGYKLIENALSTDWGQQFVYRSTGSGSHLAAGLTITTAAGSPSDLAGWAKKGTPTTVAGHRAYFGPLSTYGTDDSLVWQVSRTLWLNLQATTKTGKTEDKGAAHLRKLRSIAQTVRHTPDPDVALVKVGYLPTRAILEGAFGYTEQPAPFSAPDGTVGSGYRDLSFYDKTEDHEPASLDIFTVFDPTNPLDLQHLPTLNSRNWKQTTVQGHTAYASKSGVIVQWGAVQIHVATSTVSGSDSTLFTAKELLKVADSLTVPTNLSLGNGYPLTVALPDRHLH